MASRFTYFVAVSPGLESVLSRELVRYGIVGRVTPGGVECEGSMETLWAIHHRCRTAESVRLRLRPFRATDFAQLERGLARLPWHAYLRRVSAFRIAVSTQRSRLYHTDAIAERVRRIVENGWKKLKEPPSLHSTAGEAASVDPCAGVEQRVHVRVASDVVQVSIDASGERLHRRGYRTHVGDAPLRETLAAAAIELLLSSNTGGPIERLWDPCCGSGTLLGEWLLGKLPSVPKPARRFAFEDWPIHDVADYTSWLSRLNYTADGNTLPEPISKPCAYGSDIDMPVLRAATHNLGLARVLDRCQLFNDDFRRVEPRIPTGTAVVTNLPYGVRLEDRRTAAKVFSNLDRVLAMRSDLRPAVVLTTSMPNPGNAGTWVKLAEFANGGLRVRALGRLDQSRGERADNSGVNS